MSKIFKKSISKPTYLQIRMRTDEKEALKEKSKKHNMTYTEFIKNACNEYLKKLEGDEIE